MAERSQPGDEALVGHCINFLPLRSRIRAEMRFIDYLAEVRSAFLSAFQHQNYTFGTLVQKLRLPRDRSRTPLVSAMFNMVWVRSGLNFPGLEAEIKPNPSSFSNFDLTFNVTETDGAFALDCSYKSDLLTAPTVKRWMTYFEALLEEIAEDPDQAISKLSLAPERNHDQAPSNFKETREDSPRNGLVHEPPAMVKPRNPTEKALAQIWCELIGLDEVGVTDDFFDLGGHSVLVTQVAARIRKAFDVDIGLQPIFEKPTIAELARTVEGLLVEQIGSLTEEEAHELTAGTEVFARISE
jgi:hypothetical protein